MALKNLAARQQTAVDTENTEWIEDAADNAGTLTAKQRYERQRIQRHYDLHITDIDDAIGQIADRLGTSKSQVASWLLAYALNSYVDDSAGLDDLMIDSRQPARTLQYEWKLRLPRRWADVLKRFIHAGTIDGNKGR